MVLKLTHKNVNTAKATPNPLEAGDPVHQLPSNSLQVTDKLNELLDEPPKAVAPHHWENLSVIQKVNWYINAASISRLSQYPLFTALAADIGMLPLKFSYTPKELAKIFGCSTRALLDWRSKGLKPRDLPSGPKYFTEHVEKFLVNSEK